MTVMMRDGKFDHQIMFRSSAGEEYEPLESEIYSTRTRADRESFSRNAERSDEQKSAGMHWKVERVPRTKPK